MIQIIRLCKYIFNICKNDIIINILILLHSHIICFVVHIKKAIIVNELNDPNSKFSLFEKKFFFPSNIFGSLSCSLFVCSKSSLSCSKSSLSCSNSSFSCPKSSLFCSKSTFSCSKSSFSCSKSSFSYSKSSCFVQSHYFPATILIIFSFITFLI